MNVLVFVLLYGLGWLVSYKILYKMYNSYSRARWPNLYEDSLFSSKEEWVKFDKSFIAGAMIGWPIAFLVILLCIKLSEEK